MKRKDWTIALTSGLLILGLVLTACAPTATEEPTEAPPPTEAPEAVTVSYWHTMSDAEIEAMKEVIAMFEAEHPNIKIEMTRYAYDDFKSALLTSLAGGEGPDTARLDIIWVPELAEMEALVALDEAMPNFDGIAAKTFPGPLATNYWQGHYYGLPQDTNTQVLLWNKALFDEAGITAPPATLEEFKEVACALSKGEEQYGYAMGGTYFWAPAPIFYAMGSKVVDEDITTAEGYVNGPESVAAFQMLVDMYNEECLSPNLLGGGIGTSDGLATGLYAMIVDGPWMVDIYKADFPDFEVNFAPIPTGPDGTTSSVVGGQNVVVFDGSQHKEAAIEWVQFLLSEEAQLKMAERGVIPTLSTVIGDPSLPDYFGVFLEQLKTAQARVPHPKWGDMDGAINNAYQRMLRDEQTVQEALDQAAQEINTLLGSTAAAVPAPAPEAAMVSYWHTMSDAEIEAMKEVIAMFEAEHPNIKIEMTRYAYDDFKSALLTSLAGGEGPDTARLDIIWVPELAEMEALVALDEAMPNFDGIAAKTFPGPLATNYWQGHYYGLPQDTNTQVLLWNKALFDEAGITAPPATLEEFKEVACALSKGEEQYGYAMGGTYFWAPAPIFYAMGSKVVDEDITTAEGYVNGPESVAAFQMLVDMYNEECLSPNLLGGGIGTSDGLATGLYAMIVDGPWMVDIYKADFPDFEVNFAPIPTGPDGTTSSVVGGQNVVVFDGSQHKEAAMEWVQFLLSEEAQLKMAERGVIPTLSTVSGDPSLPDYFGVFLEQLKTAQARVPHPKWGDMDGAINNAYQRMLRGDQTVQEALDQAAQEINALLAQ